MSIRDRTDRSGSRRSLACRRSQSRRVRGNRRRLLGAIRSYSPGFHPLELETPCPCSLDCCGNPRRHWGELTLAKRRAEDELDILAAEAAQRPVVIDADDLEGFLERLDHFESESRKKSLMME